MYLILGKCCKSIEIVSIPHRILRVYVTEIPADVIALPASFIHYYVLPLWHWHSVSPCFWLFVVRLFAFICHHSVHSLAVVVVAALSRQVHKEISIKMQQCRTPSLGRRAKLTNRDTFPARDPLAAPPGAPPWRKSPRIWQPRESHVSPMAGK